MDQGAKKTKSFLLWTSLANEPFVALYALVPFLLRKELSASLLQLSLLASLRPVLPMLSFYWSANLTRHTHRLRSNFFWSWALGRAPFLFIPWFPNTWYFIFCCAVYELFKKSGTPALIEILKINMQEGSREKNYAICFVLTFIESILFGLLITNLLDSRYVGWNWLIAAAGALSLSTLLIKFGIPRPQAQPAEKKNGLSEKLVLPWKDVFNLLKDHKRFFHFQCGFMMGGIGLMFVAPALSILYVDKLGLESSQIAIGRSVLMGIGVVSSTYFWAKMIIMKEIETLLRNVLVGFSLYLLLSYYSPLSHGLFYLSNFVYGVAQAGSHLLWNLSGPMFSGDKDSTQYSRVNILMVGLRGAIIPAIGGVVCSLFGPAPTFLVGAAFCLLGVYITEKTRRVHSRLAET